MKWAAILSKATKPRTARGHILLWACLAGLIFGSLHLGQPLTEWLRIQRNLLQQRPASGDIVLVEIDDRSLKEVGRWPWPRRLHGELAGKLHALGTKLIFINFIFSEESDPANDQAFARVLNGLGKQVVLPIAHASDSQSGKWSETYPLREFSERVQIGASDLPFSSFGMVRRLPAEVESRGRMVPSFSVLLANSQFGGRKDFPVDYSLDFNTIPRVSAIDILKGTASRELIAGKNVIIGPTYHPLDQSFIVPGYGVVPATYFHIFGAETLKRGIPYEPSWLWPFLMAVVLAAACILANRRSFTIVTITIGLLSGLAIPLLLAEHLLFVDAMPAFFMLVIIGLSLSWRSLRQSYRTRGTVNAVSGLPNLTALQEEKAEGCALVAARVHNYAAIASTLRPEDEKSLAEQIAKRLSVGSADAKLFQGDEGIFAWFAEPAPRASTQAHLEALHNMSRSPIIVRDKPFDLVITFGLDIDPSRSIANRLASALVAADEAQKAGLKWKEHDNSRLADSAWKLSLLSQLDAAIDTGDLWVAYQPKLDLRTDTIVGAEALARWTHPEKGPISPMEFILAAEQSNRIEKLTHHVIESAIRVAAVMNQHGTDFNISVNLSARLIEDPELVGQIRTLLDRHGLAASRLTLEVTETAALGGSAGNLETLLQLREMGVFLSVDDYGTGMSTLDYLQRIPATEIKIDRSFVAGMAANHATKVMVNSTIQLAHSLGQKVVAEGVEDVETLEELRRMNCDLAQGYLIGRPMTFRALSKRILGGREERAA